MLATIGDLKVTSSMVDTLVRAVEHGFEVDGKSCDALARWTSDAMQLAWGHDKKKLKGWSVARVELLQAYYILESVRLGHDLGAHFRGYEMTDARLPADGRYSLSVFVDHAKALKLVGGGGWPGRVVKLIEQKGESVGEA